MALAAITLIATLVSSVTHTTLAQDTCNRLWKHIDFGVHPVAPYTEARAELDWLPASYMDGYHGDPSTKGSTNKRVHIRTDDREGKVMEVLLPKGCVTSACAMQAKTRLPTPLDSVTLSYKVKFGPNFDWVRGGKLPGLCGGNCLTGCKEVTGLDGWSARNMWRPCSWPPEHPDKALKCKGGKMAAYVYSMYKEHWCGDDYDMQSAKFAATADDGRAFQFFQPAPDVWYHIQTHIRMNSAGDPGEPVRFETNGALTAWLDGELVVDRTEMAWRQYNNVTIDTLYFSVFFGGSSPTFQAKKDETIRFADFMIYEGRCAPDQLPRIGGVATVEPQWDTMRPLVTTDLETDIIVNKPYVGGGCGDVVIKNTATTKCDRWQLEISIRPSWGTLTKWSGVLLLDDDESAGWYSLAPDTVLVTDTSLAPGETLERARVCIMTTVKAKYPQEKFQEHIRANAYCVVRGGSNVTPENAPLVEREELPRPKIASNPDADNEENTLTEDDLTNDVDCKGSRISVNNKVRAFKNKYCIDTIFTYEGRDTCTAFYATVTMNELGSRVTSFKSNKMTPVSDKISGGIVLKSPIWFTGFECGGTHTTSTCYYTDGVSELPVENMVAECTSHEVLEDRVSGDEEDEL